MFKYFSIRKNIMKPLRTGLTLTSILLSPIAKANDIIAKVQTEAFVQDKGVLSDTRTLLLLGERDEVQLRYFARDRLSISYDGTVKNILIQSLGIGTHGFRAEGQLRAVNDQVSPWVGVGYDAKLDEFFGLAEVHVLPQESPVGELNLLGVWRPEIGSDNFHFEYQGLHWLNSGTTFSGTSRVRVGYSPVLPLTVGLGSEISYGLDIDPSVQVGGFLKLSN
jgi:hypothetical protein